MTDVQFWMTGNRDGSCAECEDTFNKGDRIVWDATKYKAYCGRCGEEMIGVDPLTSESEEKEARKRAEQKRSNLGSKAPNKKKKEIGKAKR